jgi:hypothetical protein
VASGPYSPFPDLGAHYRHPFGWRAVHDRDGGAWVQSAADLSQAPQQDLVNGLAATFPITALMIAIATGLAALVKCLLRDPMKKLTLKQNFKLAIKRSLNS